MCRTPFSNLTFIQPNLTKTNDTQLSPKLSVAATFTPRLQYIPSEGTKMRKRHVQLTDKLAPATKRIVGQNGEKTYF